MITRNDYPLWVPIAMFVGFAALFFSAPAVIDDSKHIVVLSEIPFAWLLVPCALHLFLGSVGLRVYEWSDFADEERRVFLRRISLLAVIEVFSWYGGMLLAALYGWTYDTGIIVSLVPPTIVAFFWFFKKPRRQVWE